MSSLVISVVHVNFTGPTTGWDSSLVPTCLSDPLFEIQYCELAKQNCVIGQHEHEGGGSHGVYFTV